MTKALDPYSRVYWRIVDDDRFSTIYGDDRHLAAWLRLLIAADQAWPASANLPASARPASVQALVDVGLVELRAKGIFRIHGLDAERSRRQDAAAAGASARWSGSNAVGMRPHPVSNADGDAVGMPRRAKTRRDETSIAETTHGAPPNGLDDDLWALYAALTRTPARKPATLDWLDRIETTYGVSDAARVLREEHAKDGNPGTLLSRVNGRLEAEARKAENGAASQKRRDRITEQVMGRRLDEYRFTGKWHEEWGPVPEVPG